MTFRRRWLDAVRQEAKSPPDRVRAVITVAVARVYFDYGDDDGTRIQVGRATVAREAVVSEATAGRVRRWLVERGLGHVDSGPVRGRKATWWHAAVQGQDCSTCAAAGSATGPVGTRGSASPGPVGEREREPATRGPTRGPSPGSPGGTQPVTPKNSSTYECAPTRARARYNHRCNACGQREADYGFDQCSSCVINSYQAQS